MEPIYLDHAATTPVRPEVIDAMMPFLRDSWGNPSSAHRVGRDARAGLEQAKRETAEALGVEPNQVIFTSGGTEADNLAIIGASLAAKSAGKPMHVVTSAIEHKAALAAAHAVAKLDGRETVLPVDHRGLIELDALDRALEDEPSIVSIMWVNNEVGVIQPIAEIGERCCAKGVPFHTDGVQAFGKIPINLSLIECQLLSISGHKIGAPKGIGALIVRNPKIIEAIMHGGGQQFGIRPGTENVAGAVALGRAAKLAVAELDHHVARMLTLRDRLADSLAASIEGLHIHGLDAPRAPHVLSVCVPGTDAAALLMHLDMAGICVSGGSACNTGAITPSHVLSALGIEEKMAVATLRFSLGHETTDDDIDRVAAVFPEIVAKVRELGVVLGRA